MIMALVLKKRAYQLELQDHDRQGLWLQTFAFGQQQNQEEMVSLRLEMTKRPCHLFFQWALTNLDRHSEINTARNTSLETN